MGGAGSSRWQGVTRARTVEEARRISVRTVRRRECVENFDRYLVEVEQRFGGTRYYLGCPSCGSRYRTLYKKTPDSLACRRCLGLKYKSQRLSEEARLQQQFRKIYQSATIPTLAEINALESSVPEKRSYMHRRTFERLVAKMQVYKHRIRLLRHRRNQRTGD